MSHAFRNPAGSAGRILARSGSLLSSSRLDQRTNLDTIDDYVHQSALYLHVDQFGTRDAHVAHLDTPEDTVREVTGTELRSGEVRSFED